jgi:hypothetical protein
MNQEISPVGIIPPRYSITRGMKDRSVDGHSSETWSHPINMITIIINWPAKGRLSTLQRQFD